MSHKLHNPWLHHLLLPTTLLQPSATKGTLACGLGLQFLQSLLLIFLLLKVLMSVCTSSYSFSLPLEAFKGFRLPQVRFELPLCFFSSSLSCKNASSSTCSVLSK
ncbi:hypothetical protein KC19_3G223100 [Ceratodon purpureus]|uniref:Uncharacterized protein n=1 Tax=Ceratodon purpureus TaxID=3225 RepID=A0A8T0INQ0_CERPU|nr:hypothetical protein KC19_3G223100 [Ceratodon purpureus]